MVDLGMLTAAQLILEHDTIGIGPAEGAALPWLQRKHVAEAIFQADDQKWAHPGCHRFATSRKGAGYASLQYCFWGPVGKSFGCESSINNRQSNHHVSA
jgi:hypothetical protein